MGDHSRVAEDNDTGYSDADDVTGIIGLPLLHVCRLLRRFGLLPS